MATVPRGCVAVPRLPRARAGRRRCVRVRCVRVRCVSCRICTASPAAVRYITTAAAPPRRRRPSPGLAQQRGPRAPPPDAVSCGVRRRPGAPGNGHRGPGPGPGRYISTPTSRSISESHLKPHAKNRKRKRRPDFRVVTRNRKGRSMRQPLGACTGSQGKGCTCTC